MIYEKASWDKRKTLVQNYESMGLCTNLNGATGGSSVDMASLKANRLAALAVSKGAVELRSLVDLEKADVDSVCSSDEELVETVPAIDASGLGLGRRIGRKENISSKGRTAKAPSALVAEIMHQAALAVKRPRPPSELEAMFLLDLRAKYGEAFDRMERDKKLNPHLISAGQLRRKFRAFDASRTEAQ